MPAPSVVSLRLSTFTNDAVAQRNLQILHAWTSSYAKSLHDTCAVSFRNTKHKATNKIATLITRGFAKNFSTCPATVQMIHHDRNANVWLEQLQQHQLQQQLC